MTMTRSARNTGPSWDRDDERRPARMVPGSLPLRLAETALRNPMTTGGVLLSLVMIGLTIGNAVGNQPDRHPHPFFSTRDLGAATAKPSAAAPILPLNVLPRPKPTSYFDQPQAIQELQTALRDRGFYVGPSDGVLGAPTIDAIRAFERRLGSTPTGEPTEFLLAALRSMPVLPAIAATSAPTPAPVAVVAPTPRVNAVKTAAATPARIPAADAVGYPVSADASANAEPDMAVSTGTIRRAAREPLAPGGDERLQKIQRALVAAGYGPLKADGKWDERSASTVRRYEADRGWTSTGRPSDKLVYDLMSRITQARR